MNKLTVLALRVVIGLLVVGGSGVLVLMSFGLATADERLGDMPVQAFIAVMIPALVAAIVILFCVWRLLGMAYRRTVFSRAAFGYVNVVIGAFTVISALIVAFAGLLAQVNKGQPESDQLAPGVVLIVCGLGVAAFGVALVVLVMRALLAQAVELTDELGSVI